MEQLLHSGTPLFGHMVGPLCVESLPFHALLGIHPCTLYALRDAGVLEQPMQGFYRLVDLPPLTNPDLVIVAHKIPQGVVYLVSALAFHELKTQILHAIDVALTSGSARPRLVFPPVRVFWCSGPAWSEGIEVHELDNTSVRIYGPEKGDAVRALEQLRTV